MGKKFGFQIPAPPLIGFGIFFLQDHPAVLESQGKCGDLGHTKSEGLEFFIYLGFLLILGLWERKCQFPSSCAHGKGDFGNLGSLGMVKPWNSSIPDWVGMALNHLNGGQFPLSQLAPTWPLTFQGCGKWDGRIPALFARSRSCRRGDGGTNIPFSSTENPTGRMWELAPGT